MMEVMESDMLCADSFQNFITGVPEGIGVEHPARFWRWEHIRVSGVLLVLLHYRVHRLLRDGQDADGVLRFGLTHHQSPLM